MTIMMMVVKRAMSSDSSLFDCGPHIGEEDDKEGVSGNIMAADEECVLAEEGVILADEDSVLTVENDGVADNEEAVLSDDA